MEMLTKGNPSVGKPRYISACFVPCWDTWASPPPKIPDQGSPRPRRVEFKSVAEIFSRPRVHCRHQGPAFRAYISDSVADAAWQAITSWSSPPPTSANVGQIQGLWGEEGCPQNGYGTPPGRDGGAEHPPAGRSVRDRVSSHPAVELGCHHPRVSEDGRGPGQRPLHIEHGHLVCHLHDPGFSRGASS
jgi:hypothetical protein